MLHKDTAASTLAESSGAKGRFQNKTSLFGAHVTRTILLDGSFNGTKCKIRNFTTTDSANQGHVAPSRESRHHPSAMPISVFHLTIDVKVGVRHSPNGEEADASDRGKGQAQAQGLVFGLWQWINEKSKESCS